MAIACAMIEYAVRTTASVLVNTYDVLTNLVFHSVLFTGVLSLMTREGQCQFKHHSLKNISTLHTLQRTVTFRVSMHTINTSTDVTTHRVFGSLNVY